ncbi:bone morphogenetic protein 3-like [Conger conger]|uniref:bone morphogenetic protein 3-like n=1 Tax=Conger conger TaxID=82655 RepID=UPI002A5AB1CC|nr:bone morphogenetic protein 3-like [Conger conger]
MAPCQHILLLLFGWSYICGGYCIILKDHFTGLKKNKEWTDHTKTRGKDHHTKENNDLLLQDTVSEHMQMLYEKYNREGFHFNDGNTVRSFKAHWGNINGNHLQIFNLTSLTKSEDILSATLHYHIGDLQNSSQRCTGPQTFGCHRLMRRTSVHLSIWSFASLNNSTKPQGHRLLNASTSNRDAMSWQWRDITHAVNQAKHRSQLLIGIDVNVQGHRPRNSLLSARSPYVLVYANDSAISVPESAVSTLLRHRGALSPGHRRLGAEALNSTAQRRARRSANVLLPLQNNELPGTKRPYRAPDQEQGGPSNEPPEDRPPARHSRAKLRKQQQQHGVTLLRFDERTMKKARRRQWSQPRHCARRYLKVDFADIGWNEWIISPKYFDAFYCSGSCQFPMPKSVKPSNHATIQSIVRAVGVVPGIPEPCCVPENMSSLSILFFDENHDVVLKVYPNMTVDSCACQ